MKLTKRKAVAPIPSGWRRVASGVARRGDKAWSETALAWMPCAFVGKESHSFHCLIRKDKP